MGNILQTIRRIPDCLIGREGKEEEEEVFLLRGENIAETISCDLPGDLMLNILSRLPVESLRRFKCVCKAWRTLVVSPTFINMHFVNYSCKANTNKLLVCPCRVYLWDFLPGFETHRFIYAFPSQISTDEQHYDRLYLPFRPSYTENITIVGSSNGLVCIKCGHYDSSFVLWNPATKESRFLLPPPSIRDLVGGCCCFTFSYEVLTCLGVKFTYVGSIGDYKLVNVWHNRSNRSICADTFTLAKNSWKRRILYAEVAISFSEAGCIMVDGKLHWLAATHRYDPDKEWILVSFDTSEEKFCFRGVPCNRGFTLKRSLAVLNQSQLAMFVYPNKKRLIGGECIQIWVKVMGSSWTWTKHSVVKIPSLSVDIGVPIGFWPINGGYKEEEIIFTTGESLLGLGPITWKNTLYSPRDRRFRNISGFPDFVPDFTPYVETLFSVKGIGVVAT